MHRLRRLALCRGCSSSWRPAGARLSTSSEGHLPAIAKLRNSKEHLSFFISFRDKLGPREVCYLLKSLWQKVELEHESDVLSARKALFNDPDFIAILKDVLFKLNRYAARELPDLVHVLHHMTWNDKHLFKIVEPRLIQELPSVNLEDIPRVAESFVGVGCGSRVLFQELIHLSLQAAQHFSAQQVASLVTSFSRSPHKPKAFLIGFCPTVAANLNNFDAAELTKVVVAYSEWPGEVSTDFMEQVMEVLCFGSSAMTMKDMSASNLVAALRALALWRSRSKSARERRADGEPLFASTFCLAAAPIRSACSDLTAEEMAQAMWAFAKTRYMPTKLFLDLHDGVLRSFKALSLGSLASCLLNSGRALSGQLRFWDDSEPVVVSDGIVRMPKLVRAPFADRRLLTDAETLVVRRLGGLIPRDLVSVVLAYSLAHVGSPELYSVLQRACLEKCPQFPADQMSTLLWSFATIRLGPALAKEAQVDLLECLPQLTAPAVSDLLWAYCALRHRDPHFFKALLGVLSPSTVAGNARCAMLCPALLDIKIHFPEIDPEGLGRYLSYVQPSFRALQQRAAAPTQPVEEIRKALDALGMRGEAHAEVDGYVVDVVISAADACLPKPVAIQYHSAPRTLHLLTGDPLGQTMMKQRYLRACGFSVVNLLDSSWESLDEEERVLDLQAKIRQARRQPTGKSYVGA
ncbi:AL1, partial [Symbiodinium sp. CCMP2456]